MTTDLKFKLLVLIAAQTRLFFYFYLIVKAPSPKLLPNKIGFSKVGYLTYSKKKNCLPKAGFPKLFSKELHDNSNSDKLNSKKIFDRLYLKNVM